MHREFGACEARVFRLRLHWQGIFFRLDAVPRVYKRISQDHLRAARISVGRSCSRPTRRRGWDARRAASTSALDTRLVLDRKSRGNILFEIDGDFSSATSLAQANARHARLRRRPRPPLNLNEGPPSLTFDVPWPAAKSSRRCRHHLAPCRSVAPRSWIAPRRRGLLGDVKRRVGPRPRRGQRRGARRPRQGRLRPRALRRVPPRRRNFLASERALTPPSRTRHPPKKTSFSLIFPLSRTKTLRRFDC